jgi:hypothetical protein
MALLAFLKRFPDDDACWAHLEAARWPEGAYCSKCGSFRSHKVGRPHYRRCTDCRAKFTAAHGTPFEGTHLGLRVWFTAMYLVASSSKGVSSVKLGEQLGVTPGFGRVHSNTAESFNATVKRAVIGVWHWMSNKHTDRYLTEVAFRWNERKADTNSRLETMLRTNGQRLRWRELVA